LCRHNLSKFIRLRFSFSWLFILPYYLLCAIAIIFEKYLTKIILLGNSTIRIKHKHDLYYNILKLIFCCRHKTDIFIWIKYLPFIYIKILVINKYDFFVQILFVNNNYSVTQYTYVIKIVIIGLWCVLIFKVIK